MFLKTNDFEAEEENASVKLKILSNASDVLSFSAFLCGMRQNDRLIHLFIVKLQKFVDYRSGIYINLNKFF